MNRFKLPVWLKPHLFTYKTLQDVKTEKLEGIKNGLSRFKSGKPEVSIVIPVWNEEDNILRTLSSISCLKTKYETELILVNNNSTDRTQDIIDYLGIKSVFEKNQGIACARAAGLRAALGKYHLCADADTFYPPSWADTMVSALKEKGVVCVYGRYSFVPPENTSRAGLALYEIAAERLFLLRKRNREYINVLGFNFGFITKLGRDLDGFKMEKPRKFGNEEGSADFVMASEDGMMAMRLMNHGKLKMVKDCNARVWTGTRRLLKDGSLTKAFTKRIRNQSARMKEYLTGKK